MSEIRQVKIPINLDLMEKVAKSLNYEVIPNKGVLTINGINFTENGVFWNDYITTGEKDLDTLMSAYYHRLFRNKGVKIRETEKEIVYVYEI